MMDTVLILAIIGIFLSIYAYYIEYKCLKSKSYAPVCQISEKASCTKAFSSKYGTTFGLSNSVWGMGYYAVIIAFSYYLSDYIFYLAAMSVVGTFYLAYVSFIKLKNFCPICIGIYIVNILILIFSYQ